MQQQKRYLELDALRGFAAVFVMFFHYTLGMGSWWGFNLGVTGVDLFFLISGFVIFMSINKVSSGREFIVNRAARLYPTYWACVTITFGATVLMRLLHFQTNHAVNSTFTDYLANLTMFQYYLGIKNIDVPYWTLTIELIFYIFIWLVYKLNLLKHISKIGCIINAIIIINFLLVILHYIPNYNRYVPLVNHFALFFAGITFYRLATADIKILPAYTIIVYCLLTQIVIYKFAGSDPDHVSFSQYTGMLLLYFTLFTLFVHGKLKFIISKPAVFLGKISFALYLIHSYIFRGVIGFLIKHQVPFWVAVLGVAVPAVILLSYLITTYIEKPGGRKLKTFLQPVLLNKKQIAKA